MVNDIAYKDNIKHWRNKMFFFTDWKTNHSHFASLADAISYARQFGTTAVVYGPKGEVVWIPT